MTGSCEMECPIVPEIVCSEGLGAGMIPPATDMRAVTRAAKTSSEGDVREEVGDMRR